MASLVVAEWIKVSRQRGAMLFGFLLAPVFTALATCLLGGGQPPPGVAVQAAPILASAARSLGIGGNPIAQLFFAIGAATIFSVDYRYSGWRHVVPRTARPRLIAAKLALFLLMSAASLALVVMGDAAALAAASAIRRVPPLLFDGTGTDGGRLVRAFAISLAELMTLGGLVAAVAVTTRSMMAAVIGPFLLSLVASSVQAYLGSSGGVPLPTFAADALRAWNVAPAGSGHSALAGAATLAAWFLAACALATAVFGRQDLVSE